MLRQISDILQVEEGSLYPPAADGTERWIEGEWGCRQRQGPVLQATVDGRKKLTSKRRDIADDGRHRAS
jgi:hypothetical protein